MHHSPSDVARIPSENAVMAYDNLLVIHLYAQRNVLRWSLTGIHRLQTFFSFPTPRGQNFNGLVRASYLPRYTGRHINDDVFICIHTFEDEYVSACRQISRSLNIRVFPYDLHSIPCMSSVRGCYTGYFKRIQQFPRMKQTP